MNIELSHSRQGRYGSLSIGLHWVMLVLLVAVYACMELRGFFPKGSGMRDGLKTWHFMLGLSVLILVAFRVMARLAGTMPPITPTPSKWQRALAGLMHLALYMFMIGMPLMGWLTLSAQGEQIPFFGLHLPPLVGESQAVARWAKEVHETSATVGYFLIGLHAAAALFHHYLVRDDTLRRMLPSRD